MSTAPVGLHLAAVARRELVEKGLARFALRGLAKCEAHLDDSGLYRAMPMGEPRAPLRRHLHKAGARALFEAHCARGAAANSPAPRTADLEGAAARRSPLTLIEMQGLRRPWRCLCNERL